MAEHQPLTREETSAYLEEQNLQEVLQVALNQAASERAPNAALRIAELLLKAACAHEKAATQNRGYGLTLRHKSGLRLNC